MESTRSLTLSGVPRWTRFAAAHLHDYNRPATTLWLTLAIVGALTLALACVDVARRDTSQLAQIAGWCVIVAVGAWFPIRIPRSSHSIAAGDIIVFLLLALYGSAPSVLAAALQGLIGAVRASRALSSRIASLCAAAFGMTLAATTFLHVQAWLQPMLPPATAHLAAISAAGFAYYAISTMTLTQIVYLKRATVLSTAEWFGNTSWMATLYLVSSVIAGLLALNAREFGRSTTIIGIVVIALSLALVRAHFRRQIAEHEAQEARVAAAELEAAQNPRRFHSAFTHASIGMAIVCADGKVMQSNDALHALLGCDASHIEGQPFVALLHGGDAALLERHVADVRSRSRESFSIELRCVTPDRREIWVSMHCARFDDHRTRGDGLIFQLHDITSRRRAEGELHHIAYHDNLTDLANRNCFHERLRFVLAQGGKTPAFAVMVLDLDRFKTVNDSLGHGAGDELLKEVAHRLRECAAKTDLVARLGGDEFAILIEEDSTRGGVADLARRVLEALERPLTLGGTDVRPLASVGVTFSDVGYREPESVLRDADIAMYKAKADGKARVALFDAGLHVQLANRLQLETDLRQAIAARDLSLAFQPLFDLEPRRLAGFEALARWTHPTRGAVSPGVFIPLAEETGDIEALTAWAIDEAVHALATWRGTIGGAKDIVMHVNVSGRDLTRDRLVPHVRDVLARHRVPAHLLTLEITETTLMGQRDQAIRALAELRTLGVNLSIDDFGTGYSSLAYLSTLPFDCLKIDRSFVAGMHKSPQNTEIVRTVLSLGRALNKQVIAEGIETHDQLLRLCELGTPVGQGYLLGRPIDADAAQALLRDASPKALAA
jgi:diguanylate cyclase (GGDEF)-like protein/PAS domain S-box-containing protein